MRLTNVMLLNRFHGLCGPRNLIIIVSPPPLFQGGEYMLNLSEYFTKIVQGFYNTLQYNIDN